MTSFTVDKLEVRAYENRTLMGEAAAKDISKKIRELLEEKDEINMIFAAAPSQNDVLLALTEDKSIDWTRVNAYHMDEYIGLPASAPQRFGNFLKRAIFDKVPFRSVNLIDCSATDIDVECARYSKLLESFPVDIVCLGIGENGHIAFNDPGVADFKDKALVKKAELDLVCRQQQVNDGCFASLDDVPKYALTLTVPALTNGKYMFCVVPAATKAKAVKATIEGEITDMCPASILRTHDGATLYCDADSGAYVI